MAWPSYYTNNFNPNPSADVALTGYAALLGSESVSLSTAYSYVGQNSVQVSTPGNAAGEGLVTPAGAIIAAATGSASLWIIGQTGTLSVTAVNTIGGASLGSSTVVLDGTWQNVAVNGLSLVSGQNLLLLVQTTSQEEITFYVDAVQYEPESPAHPYIDGWQYGCFWTGTPGLSTSYQPFQNAIVASGAMTLEGNIAITVYGEMLQLGNVTPGNGPVVTISGQMDMSGTQHQINRLSGEGTATGSFTDPGVAGLPWLVAGGGTISLTVASPGSGFSDFAIFQTTDADPAMSLVGYNNAGAGPVAAVPSGATYSASPYTPVYGVFSPPVQSLNAAGQALWQSAAFMAVGFQLSGMPVGAPGTNAPNSIDLTDVQASVVPFTGSNPTVPAYTLPRSLKAVVKPTTMNYVPNPSMQNNATGWTAYGGATIARVATPSYDPTGSLQVTVPYNDTGGAYVSVAGLVVGDVYTASAYVMPTSANIDLITMSIGSASATAGSAGSALAANWVQVWFSFTATASTVQLTFTPTLLSGTANMVFNADCVMVAPGDVLTSYGDGNSAGWIWQQGGTAGNCPSFYYERQNAGSQAVQQVLSQHTPLGLASYDPVYGVLPAQ